MIVGKIVGKTNTIGFSFVVKNPVNKFDYVQVLDDSNNYNLCQIVELERDENKIVAFCRIVGHKDSEGRVVGIRVPFKPNSEVLKASDDFIKEILNLNVSNGAFVGTLENKRIPIYLNLNELLSKHIAILAKSGYGKSYTAGVLIEEILEHNIPIVIIDPHGEYGALRFPNSNKDEIDKLSKLSLNPKGFSNVFEYVISEEQRELVAKDGILLKLPDYFSLDEINSLFPKKLSNTQMALLYDALHRAEKPTLSNIIYALDLDDNPVKYSMIPVLEHVKNTKLFSETSTPFDEFVKPGNCSVVNLKAINPFLQGLVVYKLVNMIFNLRKKNIIPPFFLLIEEAHNFIPERTFGEKISSKILRIVASEGRKFGLSLGIISQRPARVDKSVLSQCTTNIILRITNPSDIKAVVHSFEGITNDIEKEISILPVGTAIITGLFESPVFVNVRPKKSKHGGSSIDLINNEYQKYKDKKDLDAMNINKTYHDKVNTTVTVETRVSKRDKS
ncbi:MAG: DUF87 domain-containing protein, partial [Nitrospiraceae bacterium]|nr:DUF87 domain-containing protein [Nitrospiraceae bacterium]